MLHINLIVLDEIDKCFENRIHFGNEKSAEIEIIANILMVTICISVLISRIFKNSRPWPLDFHIENII